MMFSELNRAQNQMLEMLRTEVHRGCVPAGFPAVLPMWRVEAGVEASDERQETVAIRGAFAALQETDRYGHSLLVRLLASGEAPAGEWHLVANALDALDEMVEESLDG